MINISINNNFLDEIDPEIIEATALFVIKDQKLSPGTELSIVFEEDDLIKNLNQQYRGYNETTDVLSFTSDEIDPQTGHHYIGDIIISYPQAQLQAASAGHPVNDELKLLVVHGILHLLGYDHAEEEDKEIMWNIQKKILNNLGCDVDII